MRRNVLKPIDKWAAWVKHETDRNFHRFKENPKEYYNSEAYFRMGMLVTFLQKDFGVKYNMNLASQDKLNWTDARDSKYQFLHGLLAAPREGTCASMPVLYLVVGRKLGYPLSLVCAKRHIFLRWEDAKEKINIEGSGPGVATHTDEYYRDWLKFTKEDNEFKYYLKSLSPTEEYALFLEFRADILGYNGNTNEARRIYEKALEYVPNHPLIEERLKEIQSIKNNAILAQAEHKKEDYRRKQLESVDLVNQAQTRLMMELPNKLEAVRMKYLLNNNPNESNPRQIQERMFQQSQEQARIRSEHETKMATLLDWKNQALGGEGAPITQQQLDLLEGKHSTNYPVSQQSVDICKVFQESMERQQIMLDKSRQIMEENRRRTQGALYRPPDASQLKLEEELRMQRQIITANNIRMIMEEQQRLKKKSEFTNFNNIGY